MGEWMHFPVRWVDLSKADDGSGSVDGYASVFNVVDQQDDVIERGSYHKTLADWKQSARRIPLVADHEHSSDGLIGSITKAREDPFGLRFLAEFSSTQKAQDVRLKAKEHHLDGVSIFGDIIQKRVEMVDGRPIRIISEIRLIEISLTPFPANVKALVSAVKNDAGATGQAPLDEQWVQDMRAALAIGSATVRKAAIDLLIAAYRGINTATTTDGGGTGETTGGESTQRESSEQAAAKYALAIIGESGPDSSPPGGKPSSSLADLLAPLDAAATNSDLDALEAEIKQMRGD